VGLSPTRSLRLILTHPDLIANINDNFEREYIEDSDNLSTLDGESEAVEGLEGIRRFVASMDDYLANGDSAAAAGAVSAFISGDDYFISPDNTMLLMMLQPAVSMEEFEDAMYLGYRIDDTIASIKNSHPDLVIGRSGSLMMQIDENNALAKDFGWSSVAVLVCILLLLMGSFRSWKNPFFSIITLAVAVIWTMGLIALIIHYINMMSASFALILIGLGIDFGIHVISGVRDGRDSGLSLEESVFYMYDRSGPGIMTGALTTAIVCFVLLLTKFEAFAQMGVAVGTGILTALFAMLILLPALIVWDNKGYSITANLLRRVGLGAICDLWSRCATTTHRVLALPASLVARPFSFGFVDILGRLVSRPPIAATVIVVAIVAVLLSIRSFPSIGFEYDMMKLEPVGLPSVICQDKIIEKFEISPDFAMLRARSIEECRTLTERFKKLGNRTDLIGSIDAITEFLPQKEVQRANIEIIKPFHSLMDTLTPVPTFTDSDALQLKNELSRLHQNIVEIGELTVMGKGENNKIIKKCDRIVGKTDEESAILKLAAKMEPHENTLKSLGAYQWIMGSVMKPRLRNMASTDIVTLESLPKSIKERYVNSREDAFLINVYPKKHIWEEKQLRRFNDATVSVSPRITGMPVMAMLMIDLMKNKGAQAVLFGSIAIILFLLIDFRSIKYTLFAMVPLALGTVCMVGVMTLLQMKFTMVNILALPLLIGIGIDYGVHILHRYHLEGRAAMSAVLPYTGRAVLLSALTTMMGFGSMGIASHRGIAGLGILLLVGVGICCIASMVVLPSMLTLWDGMFYKKKTGTVQSTATNQPGGKV